MTHRIPIAFVVAGAALLAPCVLAGCSTVRVHAAAPSDEPEGIRVYPPKIYLLVGSGESALLTVPDLCRPYDVKPLTVLSRQDFHLSTDQGLVSELHASQDTTAFLAFLREAGELTAKGFGVGVSRETVDSDFGLPHGAYELTDRGLLRRIAWTDGDALRTAEPTCRGWQGWHGSQDGE